MKTHMHFRTLSDLNRLIRSKLFLVPRDVDVVVGIPRSGLIPANIISLFINKPLSDIDSFSAGRVYESGSSRRHYIKRNEGSGKNILLVDDSVYSGTQMGGAVQLLRSSGYTGDIRTLSVFTTHEGKDKVDIWLEECPLPRMFEWNFMHHPSLSNSCVDIDGVMCQDPLPVENDDGPRYREFLRTASPLFLPTVKIGVVVTARLSKYRPQTEEWLTRHGVLYDHLEMLDLPDMAARLRSGCHGRFKGEVYKASSATLFIESDPQQAREIATISGKDVICVADDIVYAPSRYDISGARLQRVPSAIGRRVRGVLARVGLASTIS